MLAASATTSAEAIRVASRSGLRRAPNQTVPLTPVTDSGWTGRGQRIPSTASTPTGRYQWGDLGLGDSDSGIEPTQAIGMAEPCEEGCAPRVRFYSGGRGYSSYHGGMRMAQRPGQLVPPTQIPPFEAAGAGSPQALEVNCDLERQKLKPINAITNKIAAEPGTLPPECSLGSPTFEPRMFSCMTYTWKASNLCHKPLYFEQPRLERYGHALPPPFQPFASAAHFFVTIPILPYKIGMELPNECVYALGYYRPSSCAPFQVPGIPLSLRGALFEGGAVTGAVFALPP